MVYKKGDGGSSGEMTSLVETFTRELMRSPADLVLVAGVRLLLTDDDMQGTSQWVQCENSVDKCTFECNSEILKILNMLPSVIINPGISLQSARFRATSFALFSDWWLVELRILTVNLIVNY